ncbi:MAG: hypothetical protein JNK64_14225 [Myxococcales bacterium]|nr:hypothetical protein [Myxococcales bacterium]
MRLGKQARSNLERLLAGEPLPMTMPDEPGARIGESLASMAKALATGTRVASMPGRSTRPPSESRDRGRLPSRLQSPPDSSSSGLRMPDLNDARQRVAMAAMLERAANNPRHGLGLDDLVMLAHAMADSDVRRLGATWRTALESDNTLVAVAIAMALPLVVANSAPEERRWLVQRFGQSLALAVAFDDERPQVPAAASLRRQLIKALLAAETLMPEAQALTAVIVREHRDLLSNDPAAARYFARYW